MARPKKQIDRDIVERLAQRHCTTVEIAAVMGCSVDTIKRRFARHLPLWREAGKTTIRSKQWEAMEKGNTVMLIWLGKQYLGQADNVARELPEEPFDPVAAYATNPELRDRALQLERDIYDANKAVGAVDTGQARVPGVAVPAPHSGNGKGDDAAPKRSNGKPRRDPGAG